MKALMVVAKKTNNFTQILPRFYPKFILDIVEYHKINRKDLGKMVNEMLQSMILPYRGIPDRV